MEFKSRKIDVAYYRLDVDTFTPNQRWNMYSHGTTGYFHLQCGADDRQLFDIKDPQSPWVKALFERENKIMNGEGTFGSTRAELLKHLPEQNAEKSKEDEMLNPSEPLIEHPDSPELDKPVTVKLDPPKPDQNPELAVNEYIASFQRKLAEVAGVGVVSDSWVALDAAKVSEEEMKLGKLLDEFGKQFNYNWDLQSGIVEFRNRKWWKMRLNQIPDEWVSAWSENTRKNGVLSLDDLARISNLNFYQAQECLKPDKVLGQAGIYQPLLFILDTNLTWLRLYSSLTPQLKRVLSESQMGLNGHMLTSGQWQQTQVIFDRIGATRGEAIFRLEQAPNPTETIYVFKEMDPDTGKEDRTWAVTLPRYVEPVATKEPAK